MRMSAEDPDTFFHLVSKVTVWAGNSFRLNQKPYTQKLIGQLLAQSGYYYRLGHSIELHRIYKAVYRALELNKSLQEESATE
jgi:hypothetical protein